VKNIVPYTDQVRSQDFDSGAGVKCMVSVTAEPGARGRRLPPPVMGVRGYNPGHFLKIHMHVGAF
jgi:hypothetical protein